MARSNDLHLMSPAELAIYKAVQEVEKLGAHTVLTDVVVELGNARRKLGDFIDNTPADFTKPADWDDVIKNVWDDGKTLLEEANGVGG